MNDLSKSRPKWGVKLNNGSDYVTIKNPSGAVVVSVNYTGASDQSVCRDPDFTGEFVGHLSHSTNPRLFSPGQRNDTPLSINDYQKNRFAKKIVNALNGTVNKKKISILGWAFKKNTNCD